MKKNKGITLIALVITIIIMLILVAVTVNYGIKSGLLSKTKNGTAEYKYKEEEDEIGAIRLEYLADEKSGKTEGKGLFNYLQRELEGKANVTEKNGVITVAYLNNKEGKTHTISLNSSNNDGEEINWEKIIAEANANPDKYKHQDQDEENKTRGIGTDGKAVNMDLWNYQLKDNNTYALSEYKYCYTFGYSNQNIKEGKIQGKIPVYIYTEENKEFLAVEDLSETFNECYDLVEAPEIPNTIKYMNSTFSYCSSLEIASTIPGSVKEMMRTFSGCTNLVDIPKIEEGITELNYTFERCNSLENTSKLPNSIKSMNNTFTQCRNLQSAQLPENVEELVSTFDNCSNLITTPYLPESVKNLNNTFSYCSNLKNVTNIPENVTDMQSTFSNCTSLLITPQLPDGIEVLHYTFYKCSNLTTITNLPKNLIEMTSTFENCQNLKGVSEIPENVNKLWETFKGCSSLTGEILINCKELGQCSDPFEQAGKNSGCNLVLKVKDYAIKERITNCSTGYPTKTYFTIQQIN